MEEDNTIVITKKNRRLLGFLGVEHEVSCYSAGSTLKGQNSACGGDRREHLSLQHAGKGRIA